MGKAVGELVRSGRVHDAAGENGPPYAEAESRLVGTWLRGWPKCSNLNEMVKPE